MSNISINQASKLFKVSRNTIYSRLKNGDITKTSDGKISVQDMIRLFGNRYNKVSELDISHTVSTIQNEQAINQTKSYNEHALLKKIEQLENKIELLEKQLEYIKSNEIWLKQQLEQRLIEQKKHVKKGLLNRLLSNLN